MDFTEIFEDVAKVQNLQKEVKEFSEFVRLTSEKGTVWLPRYQNSTDGIHLDRTLLRVAIVQEIVRR